MVLVAFEMMSPELAEYFLDMDKYDRELMILNHKIDKTFSCLERKNEKN